MTLEELTKKHEQLLLRVEATEIALLCLSTSLCEKGVVTNDDIAHVLDEVLFDKDNIIEPVRHQIYHLLGQDHP